MKEVKKMFLLDIIFTSIKAGKSPSEIAKELKISKQKVQYYIGKLKKEGLIRKVGYGVWQTSKNRVGSLVRGHGFMWKVKIPFCINNWQRILEKKKINYRLLNNNKTKQIYFKERKVWLSSKSIIIYDIKSYFGFNAIESKKYAFFELQRFLIALENKLGIKLQKNNKFIVTPARSHYALIKNALAIQCRKDGTKLNVYNENGLWFTIDNSFNLEEAETLHPKTSLTDNLGIQRYFNEHKDTKFNVTPKFILQNFEKQGKIVNDILQIQQMNAENIVKHQKVLDEMLITLKKIRDNFKK